MLEPQALSDNGSSNPPLTSLLWILVPLFHCRIVAPTASRGLPCSPILAKRCNPPYHTRNSLVPETTLGGGGEHPFTNNPPGQIWLDTV